MGHNWGLIEDEIAIQGGKLPSALVSRNERQGRVMAAMDEMLGFAAKLGLSKAVLAGELGVSRISLYLWQDGKALPTMKNYCNLLRLCSKLQKQTAEECKI